MKTEKKVLISGSTGFIGSVLVPKLAASPENHILTLNRNVDKAHSKFGVFGNVDYCCHDDWDAVREFNPEIVIHLAGLSSANEDMELAKQLVESNVSYGTLLLNALSACDNLRLFVNTGSFAEYRQGPAKVDCAYLYAATKAAFQSFVDYYADKCGYRAVTAILYSVYGDDKTIKRVMDYIAESVDATSPVDMTAGEQVLDFIHVDDVAEFYCKIIQNYNSLDKGTRLLHVGSGVGTRIRDIAEIIKKVSGRECNIRWGGRPYRPRDIMYAVAPHSDELERLGWKAMRTLETELRRKYCKELND